MIRFKGASFYALSELLSYLGSMASVAGAMNADPEVTIDAAITEKVAEAAKVKLESYRGALGMAGLSFSLRSYNRLLELLDRKTSTYREVDAAANDLHKRILDELTEANLWQVSKERLRFLNKDLFKLEGDKKFVKAWKDIEEAGKCLAFERGTASVFHLMRVMEVGLRALGASLQNPALDPKRNPSWDAILAKGDRELAKPINDRSPEWRQDNTFFPAAHANLRAVKDAWRNPTMHVDQNYDPEDAEDVWNAVKAFMRHLSTKLGSSE